LFARGVLQRQPTERVYTFSVRQPDCQVFSVPIPVQICPEFESSMVLELCDDHGSWDKSAKRTSLEDMLTCGVDLYQKHFRVTEGSWRYAEGYTRTGLMTAAEEGWTDIVSEIISKRSYMDIDINENDILGETALMLASEKGHVSVVSVLLNNGADMSATDKHERHAMMKAAENGHIEVVKYFLDNGADVDMKDGRNKDTILYEAARRGHADIVSMLIDQGADVNVKNNIGTDPLMGAARNGHDTIVTMLLKNGADGVNNEDEWGFTPLMQSARFPRTIAALIDAGAEVNTQSTQDKEYMGVYYGWTALMYAADHCQPETVSILMNNGADANRVGISFLNDNGADAYNAGTRYSRTALMIAAGREHCSETVSALIDNGADVNIVSKDGNTALKFAQRPRSCFCSELFVNK